MHPISRLGDAKRAAARDSPPPFALSERELILCAEQVDAERQHKLFTAAQLEPSFDERREGANVELETAKQIEADFGLGSRISTRNIGVEREPRDVEAGADVRIQRGRREWHPDPRIQLPVRAIDL